MFRTICVLIIIQCLPTACTLAQFGGTETRWHGFDSFEFQLPVHNNSPVGNDETPTQNVACRVVVPHKVAEGTPWVWRARFFGHEPQADVALLEHGYHVAYCDVAGLFGNPEAVRRWDAFYRYLTQEHGFSKRPALEGMSRGGLIIFNWAAAHPDQVACIYADAPVCDITSWPGGKGTGKGSPADWAKCMAAFELTEETVAQFRGSPIHNLEALAQAKIPLLHVVGDADDVVPPAENTAIIESKYIKLGGQIEVIHKPGVGHHPHALPDPKPIVEFILKHTQS